MGLNERRQSIANEKSDACIFQDVCAPACSVMRLQLKEPAKIVRHGSAAQMLGGEIMHWIARGHAASHLSLSSLAGQIRGGSVPPGPSERWTITVSVQWPNLKPTWGKKPTWRNPNFSCRPSEGRLAASI